MDTETIKAARQKILNSLGGPSATRYEKENIAERSEIWESVKNILVRNTVDEMNSLSSGNQAYVTKPVEERDLFDSILSRVESDRSVDTGRATDATDFITGQALANITEQVSSSPEALQKATQTIRTLVAQGAYKYAKWGVGTQLETALTLMATYSERIPAFNAEDAGLVQAKRILVSSLAALELDQSSKPNYATAKPERNHLFAKAHLGLDAIRRAEAFMYLYHPELVPRSSGEATS